ncbi:hypothetical protein BDM02DRAFT_841864 [Thelephora ganbajun]|uniref:Uncharacterized protein n=1 Tax=Thelephora ganbajun TaxID=370292 RepID=A0ACB6Z6B9_THEGA|nr:hypothetical protein BDM02DRAFT_841864 [Thelephora ganbajun]
MSADVFPREDRNYILFILFLSRLPTVWCISPIRCKEGAKSVKGLLLSTKTSFKPKNGLAARCFRERAPCQWRRYLGDPSQGGPGGQPTR